MALSITRESKNTLTITNVGKDNTMTWDSSDPLTWDDANSNWSNPKLPLTKESKNSLSITNELKV